MRKRFGLIGGSVLAVVLVYVSCRKVDYNGQPDTKEKVKPVSKFFDSHPSADPGVQAINALMKRENEKYNFLESITRTTGYPRWDKTIVVKGNSVSGRGSTGDTASYYYIPFVRDSQQYVNASLVVKTGGGDTAVRWLSDWQYGSYGFDTTNAAAPNARKAFLTLANLEISTFGHHNFLVKDGRIFGYPDTQQLKVSVDPPASGNGGTYGRGADEYFTICNRVSICVVAGTTQTARGMDDPYSSGCGGTLTQVLYCNVYIFYGGGGSSGWTPMGSGYLPDPGSMGGTGTPGGGNYIEGWSPPPNPCGTVSQRGGAIQVCESSWVVIDDLPYAEDPVDSLLKKYSRALKDTAIYIYDHLSQPANIEYAISGIWYDNQIKPFERTTDNDSINVRPKVMIGNIPLLFIWHSHVSQSNDISERSTFSPSDIDMLRHVRCLKKNFISFADCRNKRYALVITDVAKASAFFNSHDIDQIESLWTTTDYSGNTQDVDQRRVKNVISGMQDNGIAFYVSNDPPSFQSWTLLNP